MNEEEREESLHGFEKLRATRIEKLEALRALGVNPYPYRFAVTHSVTAVREGEKALTEAGATVCVAGRVMALRGHGKTAFAHIEDATGRLQVYVKRDDVGEEKYRRFELLDLGDIVGVAGTVFRTRTEELTIKVESFEVLVEGAASAAREVARAHRQGDSLPPALRRSGREPRGARSVRQAVAPGGIHAALSAWDEDSSKSKRRCCSRCMAVPPRARSRPTTTRST